MSSFFSYDHLVPCVKPYSGNLPYQNFLRNLLGEIVLQLNLVWGVQLIYTDPKHCIAWWNLWWLSFCWRKSWCGNGVISEWVINPLTPILHALSMRQPRRKSGWTKSRCETPWWRKKCGRTGVSDLALLPTFLQISPSYTHTLSQTLLEAHTHRGKYFTSPTHSWRRIILFRPRRCCLRTHRGRF